MKKAKLCMYFKKIKSDVTSKHKVVQLSNERVAHLSRVVVDGYHLWR